ncbi:50S ribosomal protein L14 [Patescibacteria group bacterium]|nr:50S ribosomal protein L14 [Patescibacteria group bacterium]
MIQERSILKVADNSGAKMVRCFRILGGSKRRYARIGDVVIASVRTAEPRKQIKKKDIVNVLIVRQKEAYRRKDGSYVRFSDNAAVIIDKDKKEPKATRIFGPVPREIKEMGYDTIASLAEELV